MSAIDANIYLRNCSYQVYTVIWTWFWYNLSSRLVFKNSVRGIWRTLWKSDNFWGVIASLRRKFICKSSLLHSYCDVFIRVTSHVTQPLSWEVLRDEPFPVCKEVLSRMFSRIAITWLLTLGHEKCRSFLSLYCNNLKSAFHTSVLPVKVPLHLYPWPHNFKYLQLYFFKSFFATCRLFWTLEEISDVQFLTVMMIPRRGI